MSNQIDAGRSRVVTGFALGLLTLGVAFLFAPQEMCVLVFRRDAVEPLGSILGAALLGFGLMDWTARRSALGGIYGRTVVAANQAHFIIGALTLLRHGAALGGSTAYWAVTAFYVAGASYFSYLLFGSGVRPPSP